MKLDELAFVNQQLAGMLKAGIPLEGALRQLCADMRRGLLRTELTELERDLAQGIPLAAAVSARKLPPFYAAMIKVGVQSNDLPGVLLLLADYYHQLNSAWVRLKGLMFYPLIVLTGGLALSLTVTLLFSRLMRDLTELGFHLRSPGINWVTLWIAPALLTLALLGLVAAFVLPRWRSWLRWRLPGFREASLAQMASALSLLLSRGSSLNDTLDLMRRIEGGSVAGSELARWQERLRQGDGRIEVFAGDTRLFPQLFIWLAANAGEDLAGGFRRAAEIYQARATHRIELMLYACLPVSILLLGLMIMGQAYPMARLFLAMNDSLGGPGVME